jgi:hypothetical protein
MSNNEGPWWCAFEPTSPVSHGFSPRPNRSNSDPPDLLSTRIICNGEFPLSMEFEPNCEATRREYVFDKPEHLHLNTRIIPTGTMCLSILLAGPALRLSDIASPGQTQPRFQPSMAILPAQPELNIATQPRRCARIWSRSCSDLNPKPMLPTGATVLFPQNLIRR